MIVRSRIRAASSSSFVVTTPPSPAAIDFVAYSEKQVACERPPIFRPRYALSAACAASSTTGTPSAHNGSRSAGWPYRWTGMIAFVRGVTSSATRAGSTLSVSGSTSAKIGVAPVCTITLAVAGHVIGVVITSSPGPIPIATSARCIAAVPDETAIACVAPAYSANRSSSSAARGPVVSQPERIASATAATSSSPTAGGWKPRKLLRRYDSFGGIGSDEAYAVGCPLSALDGLVARPAHRQHRADPVGAAPERSEDRARLAVDAHPADAVDRFRLVHSVHLAQRPRFRDQEPHASPAGGPDPPGWVDGLAESGCKREPVQVDPERGLAELRVVPAAEPRRELDDERAAHADHDLRVRGAVFHPDRLGRRPRGVDRGRGLVREQRARPHVRQRDAECGRLRDDAIGDRQREERAGDRERVHRHLAAR